MTFYMQPYLTTSNLKLNNEKLTNADRFSTKILKDLKSNRNKLIAIETSNEPFTHLIDPLLARDRQLSEMLVDCLIHELDLKKDEVKE